MGIHPNFVKDLEFVYEKDRYRNALSSQFLPELSKVYLKEAAEETRIDEEYSMEDLLKLGQQLKELRSSVQEKVDKIKNCLDREDPLFCPVSLYAPMDYGRLEVAHTRTLAWLLHPRKEHGFGSVLLQKLLPLFDKRRNGVPFEVNNVESELICTDISDETTGRTDIWIEGDRDNNPSLIVIEAKIDASEGKDQLKKYEDSIKKTGITDVVCVFLTPNGHEPKSNGLTYDWNQVSFSKIAGCLAAASRELKKEPGYHFLRFYVASIIRDILEWKIADKGKKENPYLLHTYLNQMKGRI